MSKVIGITIRKASLLGNLKDGFDCNEMHTVNEIVIETTNVDHAVQVQVRHTFEGLMLWRTENTALPMQRKNIKVTWDDDKNFTVSYLGQFIGKEV